MATVVREHVRHEVEDDGGLLFDVERSQSGALTAHVRVYGRVTIDGREYTYDRNVRVRLHKSK